MATVTVSAAPLDPLGVALGVQFEPYPPAIATSASSPATQILFASAVYATAGATVTGVKLRNSQAAAGTLPTTARIGVTDAAGKVLAVSANTTALASWGAGVLAFPFTAPLVLGYSGVYFPCYVVNGTWGTTQPTPVMVGAFGASLVADGANPPAMVAWAGQTDLPAVGQSITLTTNAANRVYYLALY